MEPNQQPHRLRLLSSSQKLRILERVRLPNARPPPPPPPASRKLTGSSDGVEESPSKPAGFSNRERLRTAFRMRAYTLRQSSEGACSSRQLLLAAALFIALLLLLLRSCGAQRRRRGGAGDSRPAAGGDDPHPEAAHQGRQVSSCCSEAEELQTCNLLEEPEH